MENPIGRNGQNNQARDLMMGCRWLKEKVEETTERGSMQRREKRQGAAAAEVKGKES